MSLHSRAKTEEDAVLFEKIYQSYADDVSRRIFGILKDRYDTEDVSQETWKYILEHLDIFRGKPERSVRSYLLSVAKNQAISAIRKRRRDEKRLCVLEEADIAEESELFELCAERCDQTVLSCIMAVGEPYTSVLTHYYLYHRTLKEISRIMKQKESTVGSRLTRGRKKLIELLKERGIHD